MSKESRKRQQERQKLKRQRNKGNKSTFGIVTPFFEPTEVSSTNIYNSNHKLTYQLPGCFEGNFR